MSEEKKKGLIEKVVDFFEIEEVKEEIGKPPAKTEEKPVPEVMPKEGEFSAPEEKAIEPKTPEPLPIPEIGEKGRRDRIKID